MPDVVDARLRLQFLGRDHVMLPSVMASDPAHDPNALQVPVEALKKPHVLSIYNPAFRAIQKQREPEHGRLVSNLLSRLTGKRNAPRPENSLLQLRECYPRQSDSGHDSDGHTVVKVLA